MQKYAQNCDFELLEICTISRALAIVYPLFAHGNTFPKLGKTGPVKTRIFNKGKCITVNVLQKNKIKKFVGSLVMLMAEKR